MSGSSMKPTEAYSKAHKNLEEAIALVGNRRWTFHKVAEYENIIYSVLARYDPYLSALQDLNSKLNKEFAGNESMLSECNKKALGSVASSDTEVDSFEERKAAISKQAEHHERQIERLRVKINENINERKHGAAQVDEKDISAKDYEEISYAEGKVQEYEIEASALDVQVHRLLTEMREIEERFGFNEKTFVRSLFQSMWITFRLSSSNTQGTPP